VERKLDFMIVGAPKAGTTALFEYLRTHPQIYMPAQKETSFFLRRFERGWDWYADAYLAGAPAEAICGEASVVYMAGTSYVGDADGPRTGPWSELSLDELARGLPLRIHSVLPDAKVIAMLRDPIQRAMSAYRMAVLYGTEKRSFDEAVDELLAPEVLDDARRVVRGGAANNYLVRGEYGRILAGYRDVFPPEQVLAVFSSELKEQTRETVARVFEYIGVDPGFVPPNLETRYRTAATRRRTQTFDILRWQRRMRRSPAIRRAWRALPDAQRTRIIRVAGVARLKWNIWNAQRGEPPAEIDPKTFARLVEHFRPDSEQLAALLGAPPHWLADWEQQLSGRAKRQTETPLRASAEHPPSPAT
jgi:hypothetical protein